MNLSLVCPFNRLFPTSIKCLSGAAAGLALALAAGPTAFGIDYAISLDTAQEIPAPTLNGSTPTGEATVTVNLSTGGVTVAGTYTGATSAVSAAHLHGPAPAGETAGVAVGLTVSGGTTGTLSGGGTLNPDQLVALIEGRIYLNVHTANNGSGELRGQVVDSNIRLFDITLDSDQEVPAPNLGGSTPTGQARVLVDATTGAVEVLGSYTGTSSAVSAAHIHGIAPAGQTAGVLLGLTVSGGTTGTITGNGTLTGTNLAALFAARAYVNVHTANNGAGEIRGQITDASIREFDITLDPGQEIPAPNLGGANPTGEAVVVVDAVSGKVFVSGSYDGTSSAVSAAHIHGIAPAGQTAGVLLGLTVSGGTTGTITGNGTLTGTNLAALFAARAYVNVHTANNGAGEIRGQITDASIREFDITLDPGQEIPAPNLGGANPTGEAVVVVDAVSGKVFVSGSYDGTSSAVSAAHIHGIAPAGQTAGVLLGLTVSGGTTGTITGNGTLTGTNLAALFAARAYVNVHTANNGAGEIRGQITDALVMQISVPLDPSQEVPAPNLGGATPSGLGTVLVDSGSGRIFIEGTYTGLSSTITGAHLHGLAGAGETAGVIIPLTVSGGTEGTFTGSGTLSEAQVNGLFSGQTYLNVHTANNGAGEIRGQVPAGGVGPEDPVFGDDVDIDFAPGSGEALISFDSSLDHTYDLEASIDLITFIAVLEGIPGTGTRLELGDPGTLPGARFFRILRHPAGVN